MLVLSRKVGQALLLGKDIEITVLRVDGDQIRLGVRAPKSVSILRKELIDDVRTATADAGVGKAESAKPSGLSELAAKLRKQTSAPATAVAPIAPTAPNATTAPTNSPEKRQ